ncbi:PEP-CTERM sorting domain-containing protein [Dapis sp. BLCC M126]|uniref:PEP-CTERM sorting domain-containing protein n=1 Tax=Dapis sp. BLCC M126 TaxID=3400189 RepID=UPI003CE67CBF
MKTAKKLLMTAVGTALVVFSPGKAEAAKLIFTAQGEDSGIENAKERNKFFKLNYQEGPDNVYIEKFVFDLSPDPNAIFDFSNGNPGGSGFPFQVSQNSDITDDDIKNYFLSDDLQQLTVKFKDGAFSVSEVLKFGVDTDGIAGGGKVDDGGDFGIADIAFRVTLSNGTKGKGFFDKKDPLKSVAILYIADPQPVPEPTTVLGLFAISGLGAFSLKRQ